MRDCLAAPARFSVIWPPYQLESDRIRVSERGWKCKELAKTIYVRSSSEAEIARQQTTTDGRTARRGVYVSEFKLPTACSLLVLLPGPAPDGAA